ncbi:hypothetical protein KSF_085520 [Reticulibacter mediterranei]|uniref:Uncharacterized protein n=1 Tax=Reticulibacter mediterranei TaxID=2778369 RepID=A0A8J3IMU3_9CHLR|nr:hypothetical protein [Reticulibacter mediterranei]GHO98504.1 hypothetical protein KSF_085520 [Reticulibacter mediterranei]
MKVFDVQQFLYSETLEIPPQTRFHQRKLPQVGPTVPPPPTEVVGQAATNQSQRVKPLHEI